MAKFKVGDKVITTFSQVTGVITGRFFNDIWYVQLGTGQTKVFKESTLTLIPSDAGQSTEKK
jgi:hypothetical protein